MIEKLFETMEKWIEPVGNSMNTGKNDKQIG